MIVADSHSTAAPSLGPLYPPKADIGLGIAPVRLVQILLQNPLAFLPKDDSVALMRFAVEAIDDGAAQSRPRRVFLFISS